MRPRYPLVCFDLDGTLIQHTVFIWSTLHEHFATNAAERKKAREDFFARRITYADWFFNDLELLTRAGADRDGIVDVVDSLRPTPGAHETLVALKRAGCRLAVISGSIDLALTRHFDPRLFDHVLINRLRFDAEGKLAGGEPTPFDLDRKAQGLERLASLEGIPIGQTAFIGDNYNDTEVAKTAGLSIAFNCKSDELKAASHIHIEENDLRLVLPHLLSEG